MKPAKNITINNSTVNFYDRDIVAEARDELCVDYFTQDTKTLLEDTTIG